MNWKNHLSCILLILTGTACATFSSGDAFQEARREAAESDQKAEQVVQRIAAEMDSIPPAHRITAIETLGSIRSPAAEEALFRMLEHPGYQNQMERERIIQTIAEKGGQQNAERLYERFRARPELMNDDLMLFLGREQIASAIPDIKNYIEQNRFIFTGLKSLGLMNHESAEEYLLLVARNPAHPGRAVAVENLGRFRTQQFSRPAEKYVHQLLASQDLNSQNVFVAAIMALGHMGYRKDNYAVLKNIYETTPDEKIRNQSLEALAKMRGMDSHLMARDLSMPLAESTLALRQQNYDPPAPRSSSKKSRRQSTKKAATAKKEIEKKNEKPAASRSSEYRLRLIANLSRSMPEKTVASLLKQINNAFLAYSNYDDSASQFVRRSFAKFYSISEDEARNYLSRGLTQDRSLHAVLKNVIEEYKTTDMRSYAVSQLFSIPRWQASVLVEYAEKGQL
ncbi:MAG: HEAT repeat domain-containing protein [Spirochaetales bacterium]|nr:HEAT repeat domain-containing protein [Spirochaetales bacterium]